MSRTCAGYGFWIATLIALTSGCASVDFDHPKSESSAVAYDPGTFFGKQETIAEPIPEKESRFYLLIDGIEALAARLRMAEHATLSIDAQYYLITDDRIGYSFIGSLLDAADRGVRVRLLVDDIQTQGYDAGMAALDSHPNFQVRVFNPFTSRGARITVFDFARVNRRMHNKSFVVDNQIAIIGGRNIAAEYFAARDDVNFGDVDVLAVGPVVRETSEMFDAYWNHRAALPVPAFADMPADPAAELERLRARIAEKKETLVRSEYVEVFGDSLQSVIDLKIDDFVVAPYELAYDSPDKSDETLAVDADSITTPLRRIVLSAESELIIVSPYFVPLDSGVKLLTDIAESGVDVLVITNSLAATNHAVVHSGYAPSREALLRGGVRIYEVQPDAAMSGIHRRGAGGAIATLHTKGFVVDREQVFFGSFNWDPRSARINTELGVVMRSPELGQTVADLVYTQLDKKTYEVVLDASDRLRWIDRSGPEEIVLDKEPHTSAWRRFVARFWQMFPVENQL